MAENIKVLLTAAFNVLKKSSQMTTLAKAEEFSMLS